MSAAALLREKPKPTDEEIDDALSGQPLPLRHLPADPRSGPEGGPVSAPVVVVRRRAFLQLTGLTAGALILGVRSSEALAAAGEAGFRVRSLPEPRLLGHGHDRGPPLGDGAGDPHGAADGRGRRDGGGLRPGRGRSGPRRRAIRRPEHRRVPQRPRLLRADAHRRRLRAPHAGHRCGEELGRGPRRVRGVEPPGAPPRVGPEPGLRRARRARRVRAGARHRRR